MKKYDKQSEKWEDEIRNNEQDDAYFGIAICITIFLFFVGVIYLFLK